MAKKTHSSRQPSSENPHAKKPTQDDPSPTTTPPPSKPSLPSQPPSPSNSSRPNRYKKQTPIAAAAAAAKSSNSHNPFSKNDVILILKALSDFKSHSGNDPTKHAKVFHDSLKDSLSITSTVRKLREKVRVLRLKFEKNCQINEKDLTFSSSYEKEIFELSKKFWGQEKRVDEKQKQKQPKEKNVAKKPVKEEFAKGESSGEMGHVNLSESFDFGEMGMGVNVLKRGMELLGEAEREELESRWKKLKTQEMEVLVMRAELAKDYARLILDELEG